ncbi:MAG: selenium-dependent xanthine dehydrogenase [Chlorobi bacterium]|nr:selenium-dependent xanthine dehydrogenase [Chlorobiota bacterium]
MIEFKLNGETVSYKGNDELTLLKYLRNEKNLTAAKDGCSGQAVCGACLVEINGKGKLACVTKMKTLNRAAVLTMEGLPEKIKETIGKAFVEKGAVQCGFCTPGFIMRTKVLLQENPNPTRTEIKNALKQHLCRCTGYKKILDGIEFAAKKLTNNQPVEFSEHKANVGKSYKKYNAYKTAIGERAFVDDLRYKNMVHAALKFSDYPKAVVKSIKTAKAEQLQGVIRVFTAKDIPGKQKIGLIFNDWPLMIEESQTTHYIGDVIAGVVAETDEIAKKAVSLIEVKYEVLEPVTDAREAILKNAPQVHKNQSNLLENTKIKRGDAEKALKESAFTAEGTYETQRIEHAFLEKETAIAMPHENGIELYSQSQGVYEDRRQVASLLGISENNVRVILVPNGGGFGGKEDMSVQGHVSLYAFLLQKTVKLSLTREESMRMHPKRHPVYMDMKVGCDKNGKLTALKLRAIGDTGAYASVGTKVLERVAGHATAGYYVPVIDLEAKTVYTNNIPSGAMRGFGANQVAFALESCLDELCEMGGFDRWQFRYDNALIDGLTTATGQKLQGVGIRACLNALKSDYKKAKYKGLACAIKNSGVGNGMADFSNVKIEILSNNHVRLHHGWTEMGQGVHNMALQTLVEETGINPEFIEVVVDTNAQIKTGMTTSSRATALVGNAIIDASKALFNDLKSKSLEELQGKVYNGSFIYDKTNKPGTRPDNEITHYSYGYAAQLCVLNQEGKIEKVVAAHDAGKIMNPKLFEGQIEGAVHMGVGYALSEELEMKNGFLVSDKMRDLKILKAHEMPEVIVKGVEVPDPVGPYGAKGVGEIGLVPTAAAVANAFYQYDGKRRTRLPILRNKKNK